MTGADGRIADLFGRLVLGSIALALLAGCAAPQLQARHDGSDPARLAPSDAVMGDGYRLPLRRWGDESRPRAVLLALHGFNDYANAFARLGPFLAAHGIATYAYDQRGFGATAQRGRWAGDDRLIDDLETLSLLLAEKHPGVPLYLLGESMGGAVVMSALAERGRVDGIVLVAPAVWSRDTMNPFQRLVLQVAAHTLPWLELTGDGLDIWPSDNVDMLRELSADPLVIKRTRVDALWGITNVMDRAMAASRRLNGPVLLLYGERDEIIPPRAFCTMVKRLPDDPDRVRVVLYRDGWHMLTRDLQGERVLTDIAAWIRDRDAPLPSGEEIRTLDERLIRFCGFEIPQPVARPTGMALH